jgi:hydrogenase-4 component E
LSTHLNPLATSLASLTIISSLLLAFVLLGSRWFVNYLYAFAAQSWSIGALSAIVGYFTDDHELYLIAALTALFRGLLLPYLVWRMIERLHGERELHELLRPASGMVIGAFAVIFAFSVSHRIVAELGAGGGALTVLALAVMMATMLIGFLMLVLRQEALSQIVALLVLENGIRVGALVLIPQMPLLLEWMILFDVLIAVACFGVLLRYLQVHAGTTSARELRRLVG